MTLPTGFVRLIRMALIAFIFIVVPCLGTSEDARPDTTRIVRVYSPEELTENPELLLKHPFGVVIGTVSASDTDKPIPNAMITLVTSSLLQEKGLDGLDFESGRTREDCIRRAVTDGRGVFGFYYIPSEYLSKEFVLIVQAIGSQRVIRYGITAERGKATVVSVQTSRRH